MNGLSNPGSLPLAKDGRAHSSSTARKTETRAPITEATLCARHLVYQRQSAHVTGAGRTHPIARVSPLSHLSRLSDAAASVAASRTPASFIRRGFELLVPGDVCPLTAEKIATSPASAIGIIRTPATPADSLQCRWRNAARGACSLTAGLFDLCRNSRSSPSPDDPFRSASPRPRAGSAAPPSNGEPSLALPTIANLVCPGGQQIPRL